MHDMEFLEASAKTSKNVKETFFRLAADICELKSQQMTQPLVDTENHPSLSMASDTTNIPKGGSCVC